jgi:pimeloyl-ACP methyl ester carboxylesterase
LPKYAVSVVAGSNGCSLAVRLALAFPNRIERFAAGMARNRRRPTVDSQTRIGLTNLGVEAHSDSSNT